MIWSKKINFEKYAITRPMEGPIANFLVDKFCKHIDFTNEDIKILDYGCGDGKYLGYFSQYLPKHNLKGVEISSIRCTRVIKKGFECKLIKNSKERLEYEDNAFDVILMIEVIEHVPRDDIHNLLAELGRLLRIEGMLLLTTPNYPTKHIYDFLSAVHKGNWKRILDDPTHITCYNFSKLKNILGKHYSRVTLLPTGGLLKELPILGKFNVFSHKIFAICIK